jgi:hypothetical protein
MQASADIAAAVQAASIAWYLQISKHSTTFMDVLHIKDVLHINQCKFIVSTVSLFPQTIFFIKNIVGN